MAVLTDSIYLSMDSGLTWRYRPLAGAWKAVACCNSGRHVVVVDGGGFIWTSEDYGETWSNDNDAGSNQWFSVTMSQDGSKLAAGASDSDVYSSSDYGKTWLRNYASSTSEKWWSMTSSSDGSFIAAAAYGGPIYTGSPAVPTAATSGSEGTCFSADSAVQLRSGETKPISEVVVGDSILSSDKMYQLAFSTVISVPHLLNSVRAEFVQITLASGRDVKVTASHLIPAGGCDTTADHQLLKASQLKIGDCLIAEDGLDAIVSLDLVEGHGLYTLVTDNPLIVVNGIIASPFAVSHRAANTFYDVYRALYSCFPGYMASYAFIKTHEAFGFAVARSWSS